MSKKNIPSILPSSLEVHDSLAMPGVQPMLSGVQSENGKAAGTPLDSIAEFEKTQQEEEGYGAGVWYNSKKVNGLWSKAETRNGWVNLSDLGWKKFYNGSDSSVVAFAMLAGQAMEKQNLVNVCIENDMIIEMYVW